VLSAILIVQSFQQISEAIGHALADDIVIHDAQLLADLGLDVSPQLGIILHSRRLILVFRFQFLPDWLFIAHQQYPSPLPFTYNPRGLVRLKHNNVNRSNQFLLPELIWTWPVW
jgi:hypothetical protein